MNVAIVGLGARTPVGYRAPASAAAIRCNIRRLQLHPFIVDGEGEPIRVGLDPGLRDDQMGAVRLVVMGRSAVKEALSGLDVSRAPQLDVVLALPDRRPGFSDRTAEWVANELADGLLPRPVELGPSGHAGALDALRQAAQRIEAGHAELCVIVGIDSYLAPDTVDWLIATERLGGGSNPDGFALGEAGTCMVVAHRSLGYRPLAFVRGAHSAQERATIRGEEEPLGHALSAAIKGATVSLRLPEEALADVYCDLNGERYRTDEWGAAMLRTGHAFRTVDHTQTSTCVGDVGAAHGPLGCILSVRSWARGYANGPRALICGGSEAGLRTAVLLEESPTVREPRPGLRWAPTKASS